jgi:hypothetical protein
MLSRGWWSGVHWTSHPVVVVWLVPHARRCPLEVQSATRVDFLARRCALASTNELLARIAYNLGTKQALSVPLLPSFRQRLNNRPRAKQAGCLRHGQTREDARAFVHFTKQGSFRTCKSS